MSYKNCRYFDEEEHKSLLTSLATKLGCSMVFLVNERARFGEKLACDFCVLSFVELGEWFMNDQLAEVKPSKELNPLMPLFSLKLYLSMLLYSLDGISATKFVNT